MNLPLDQKPWKIVNKNLSRVNKSQRERTGKIRQTIRIPCSPTIHRIPPDVRKRTNEAHTLVQETTKARKWTTKARNKVLVPTNICKQIKKARKEELKVENCATVKNTHNGLRGNIGVVTGLTPKQLYVKTANGEPKFRKHKQQLKKNIN